MAGSRPEDVRRVASIGGGPIGGGWTAHFLARGYEVCSYLHAASEERTFRRIVETAWRSLEALGLEEHASLERLRVTSDLAGAVGKDNPVPEAALSVALWLSTEVAARSGRAEDLLMALTGRAPLPSNLLGLGPDS